MGNKKRKGKREKDNKKKEKEKKNNNKQDTKNNKKEGKKGKLRILMLNYEFPPLGGGAGNATYYLLKEFSKFKELEIDLITSSTGKYKEKKFSKNIRVYFLDIGKKGSLHYQKNSDLLKYSYKAYKLAKKLKKQKDYDLCHAFFGIPCGYIAMKLKIPYIVSLRGSDVPGHNPKFKLLDKLFFKRLSKKIWKNAKEVIVNSKDLKEEANKTSNKKIKIIFNGVDTEFYKKKKINEKNKPRVLFVGRLSIVKGLNYLLEGFSKLDSGCELVLVGDGDKKQELKTQAQRLGIQSKVKFLGILNKNKLVEEYSKADIFVLPSLKEGMSNTLLEAMSCELPVVITKTGGSEKLIKNNGIVVNPASSKEIFNALNKLINDKKLLSKMGKQSRKIVKNMSWNNIAKEYWGVYGE